MLHRVANDSPAQRCHCGHHRKSTHPAWIVQSFGASQVHRLFSTGRYVGISVTHFTKSRLLWSTNDRIRYAIEWSPRERERKKKKHVVPIRMHASFLIVISDFNLFFILHLVYVAWTGLAYPNSSAEFEIGEILIGLLQVLQFNAHEVCDLIQSQNSNVDSSNATPPKYGRFVYIGVAIYNSAAYFNHNCYPAVTRYFIGKTIVLCATRPLEPGATIAENYGPIFTRQTLRERQRSLSSRYWFRCECISCKENWPTLDKLNDNARLRYAVRESGVIARSLKSNTLSSN